MENISDWVEEDGMLTQTFECENYEEAIDLMNRVAVLAQEADHHPDMLVFDYKFLSIMMRTHSEDTITDKDYALAAQIDDVVEADS